MRGSLSIASAQPACEARDVAVNARVHAEAVRVAKARVVVFPESTIWSPDGDVVARATGAPGDIARALLS